MGTVFSGNKLRLRQERNRFYKFMTNEACGDICQAALKEAENQTEVTAVNHKGELGWISSGSTWIKLHWRRN